MRPYFSWLEREALNIKVGSSSFSGRVSWHATDFALDANQNVSGSAKGEIDALKEKVSELSTKAARADEKNEATRQGADERDGAEAPE